MERTISDADYRALAAFRSELRGFLHFSEQAAQASGLTPQQHQAMLAVRGSRAQALTVGELADCLLLQPHSASGLVSRLEKLGLIARTCAAEDGRRVLVRLTPRADALLAELSAAHREELRRLRPMLTRLLEQL